MSMGNWTKEALIKKIQQQTEYIAEKECQIFVLDKKIGEREQHILKLSPICTAFPVGTKGSADCGSLNNGRCLSYGFCGSQKRDVGENKHE
jgi:hypothetical protein